MEARKMASASHAIIDEIDDDDDRDDNSGSVEPSIPVVCASHTDGISKSADDKDTGDESITNSGSERFSSIEPRSPTSPNGNDPQHMYPVTDFEDSVFTDEKDMPKVPPTPGTAASLNSEMGWSKRKLRIRDIVLITVGVFLLVALAVAIPLIVIFVNKDSSSSLLSSSSPALVSTTEPTATSSSQATAATTSTTSSHVEEIHYDGHLNLSSPWETSVVELESLFVHDMKTLIATTPLYKSFIKSSLLNVSTNEKLIFTLDFKRSLLDEVNRTEEITDSSLARTVQTILRKQVVTNPGIKLPIKADSIVILENIPKTITNIATTTPVSSSTEAETKGPCLSMTFEPCHSLLESFTFYLPNILHHKTALQAEDTYRELTGPTVNTSCSDFSIFYLCSLLFPSCDMKNTPLYPCDTFCEVVKNDCGVLNGWPQNCTDLPKLNCKVPEIKSTTESQTMLTATSTASTTALSTVTSTTVFTSKTTAAESTVTTIQTTFQCVPFIFTMCNTLGLNETVLPSIELQCHDVHCLIERFHNFAERSLESECTSDLSFFCAYTFRGCNKDNILDPIGPCVESCIDAVDHCGKYMPHRPDCFEFNRTHIPCIPSQPAPLTTTPSPYKCIDQTYSYCASEGFVKTSTVMLDGLIETFKEWALPTIESGCSELTRFFYCGIFFPICEDNNILRYPCRKYCTAVTAQCRNESSFPLDCTDYDDDEDQCVKPISTRTSIGTTVSTVTTTLAPHCEPLKSSLCSHFGYSQTSFPNLWADRSAEEANKTYYMLAEASVASGCSPNILFYVCSALFPSCVGNDTLRLPCTSYCEEVNENCPQLFRQDCEVLSDPRTDHCVAPPDRTACLASEFSCININKCVPLGALCNKQNDCGDWSDERKCECDKELEVPCAMGLCILSFYRCDDIVQCPDSSDEVGCECKMNQYKCNNSSICIMPEWLCDGQFDCPDGDDENFCHNCAQDEFMCIDNACIPASQKCDGIPQCADHSDEMKCIHEAVTKTDPFFIEVAGNLHMICSEGFTEAHGETTCLKMGQRSLKSWTTVTESYFFLFQLDPSGDKMTVIGNGNSVRTCPSGVVVVECNPRECGLHVENLPSLIINGQTASPGAWPWMVSLRKYNIHECGGAIIHPYFILTAAHCIDASLDYSNMWIVAGSSRLSQSGTYGQLKKIRRGISYPGFNMMDGDDIALLELEEPLHYTEFVKPLCFPEKKDVFTRANYCVIAGWGHTKGVKGETSEYQQETKLTLWKEEKCNSSFIWNGRLMQNEMCAGYVNGLVAACSGDSGSPVACQDETLTWKAVGVASYVYKTCSVATKPLVFTLTQPYVEWIKNHTVCQFTCGDGICLFDKEMLCDTIPDCKDKSDEIDLCDVSANCTFTDKFLCGYQSSWQFVTNSGPNSVNRLPLFDHTVGSFPGMFLLAKIKDKDVISPRIVLNTTHCMRFHYHMRGKVENGMAISAHSLDRKQWLDVWSVSKVVGQDRWLMGMFELESGQFDVYFRPYDNRRFALDDTWLIEGRCDTLGCFEGEFMCETYGTKNCLPLAVKCNIVVDCDNGEDEMDCAAPVYTCDFENGNICGLEQHSDDTIMSEWIMVNSSSTPSNLRDHTFGNDSGTMLKVNTETLLKIDQVLMSQVLQLDDIEHCLKFFYASTSPVTLQVTLEWDFYSVDLIKFTNRKTQGWISTQATLPTVDQNFFPSLIYAVTGGELGRLTVEQAIMLDDISITRGHCPTFSCPTGSLLCEGEAYCVTESKICDRIIDCNSGTDEFSCECNATEFKCPAGPCIPKRQTCDFVKNCPDGSDEGAVCDHKRSVSCDFEDAFLCGYKVNTSLNVFHWERAEGKTGNTITGPSSDHTFIGEGNLIGFYIVADSQYEGDYTALESVPFTSGGNGLVFFYHAQHFLSSTLMTGQLALIVTFMNNGTQRQLWSDAPNNEDKWKKMCLELPVGNISISFVAQRGSNYFADIALDDILLLDTSCDLFLTEFGYSKLEESRIGSGITPSSGSHTPTGCPDKACRNGMCLPADSFCDHINDCPDGSDEFDC